MVLLENTKINIYPIDLEKGKQLLYKPIYSPKLVELEILKNYIKTNLANNFIKSSKSLVSTSILFNRKPDRNFCLDIDYQGLNNLSIKN